MIHLNSHRRASALLLSFFLTSMLIGAVVTVSLLVTKDIRTVSTVTAGQEALYAADGMSELGLLALKQNLPGYEPTWTDVSLASTAQGSLETHAREYTVPCEDQGNEWRALAQNESIQLPLFAQTAEDGAVVNIQEFYVEFYVGDPDGELLPPPTTDVLRWKILGLVDGGSGTATETEAISEYIPLHTASGANATSSNPAVFGTNLDGLGVPTGYQYGKYTRSGGVFKIYPIGDFLSSHSYNYLVLTNVVNRSSENTLYIRLHTEDEEAVCEYAELASTGSQEFPSVQQETQTLVREGENLPVFDFVIYHTNGESSESDSSGGFSVSPVSVPFDSSIFDSITP